MSEIQLNKQRAELDNNKSISTLSTSTTSTPLATSMPSKGKALWVICNGFRLYNQNKQQLLNGKELNDMHINGACSLIREQYPAIGGLQSTLFQQYNHPLVQSQNAIQILHIQQNHWAVISTLGCEENGVNFYDSLYSTMSLSTKSTIVKLLQPNDSVTIRMKNVAKQVGGTECGLYALAYCVALANGEDPCDYVYDQREMRSHLISCFESKHFTSFPSSKKRRIKSEHIPVVITICPSCKVMDTGTLMVHCEECTKWYHKECVPPFDEDDDDFNWLCPGCLIIHNQHYI